MSDPLTAQYAEVQDVAAELGEDIVAGSVREKQIQRWLDKAERQIRARIADLDVWAKADPYYKATVNDVEVSAVERKARNPDGLRSIMTQIDDGNFQQTIDASRSSGEIIILPEEWSRLLKSSASTNAFSFNVRTDAYSFPLPAYPCSY